MPDITFADISEFQGSIDAQAYLQAGHQVILCRVHNGYRMDHMMPARRDYLRWHGFTALGWYQYLASGVDAAQQAREFCATVGVLRDNEFAILDLEEGAGDQSGRAQAWFNVVDPWARSAAMLYSGESFLEHQLGGAGRWPGRPLWVAAYRSAEPSMAHTLWQNTSTARFPGIAGPCDGSIHHGTAEEFHASVTGGKAPLPITPTIPEDLDMLTCGVNANGDFHLFQEMPDHSIRYTWQRKGENAWNGGQPGKQVASMTPFAPAPHAK